MVGLRQGGPEAFTGYVGLIPDGEVLEDIQLSYRFETRHWGKGYAREAAARLLRHGFETLSFSAIGITTHPLNLASLRLAKRLGFAIAPIDRHVLIGEPPVVATRLLLRRAAWRKLTPPGA